jgi:histone acetyltransferase HTATIP
MVPSISSITPDHESIIWPIASFAVSNDFQSSRPAHLLLDRANAELGLIYQTGPGTAVMAQFPDTDEPIYFQVSKARAACTRFNNTCKKLDLVFTTGANAADLLQRLGRIATKVGNLHFDVHEAAS